MKAANDTARINSVSELTEIVKDVVEGSMVLRNVCVRGEISNFTRRPGRFGSDYLYFTLKDAKSQLSCVMFEGVDELDIDPENGMSVVCEGMITVYPAYGKYQLKCYTMSEDGAGAAAAALEALKARLLDEGLFSQKRERPRYPKKIAVITSPTGAAVHDIENVISRRYPVTELCVIPAYVQGVNAVPSLVDGLAKAQNIGADLIIFGRGGGSKEDLDCFNSEPLARAIYASKIPTISAVGHEIDTTIADLVADMRAPTPSAAAELAVPDISMLRGEINGYAMLASKAMKRKLTECENRLSTLGKDVQLRSPRARIVAWETRLANIQTAVSNTIHRKLDSAQNNLERTAQSISDINPLAVLSRGYAVAKKDGKAVKSAAELNVGDIIDVKLNSGEVSAEVKKIEDR
ncbi:MAG: exodeoxyribonuclease VII large subunit [Oscillospiraceae bacterium]|nr:exodeoxyribonuclease VII large subunit [Oscillospiraceae bacterium]